MATRGSPRARADKQPLVLVVDDDDDVGAYVRAALSEPKFRVAWCPDVRGALEAIRRETPDLAILDINLANEETGWDVLKPLRSDPETERMPIVMLTGSADTLNRERSMRMGADRYLVKPVRPETLRRVVNEMLSARDDIWWSLTLRDHQVQRLRELFYDATTEVPTLALVVEDLRKLVDSGEILHVFCVEIEPLFRLGERDHWRTFDDLRREFARGLRVVVGPILGNDVVIATSHAGANDFFCFARDLRTPSPAHAARELERLSRQMLRSLAVDPAMMEEVIIFAGGTVTERQPLFAPRILYNAVREAKDSAEKRETRFYHGLRERLIRAVRGGNISTVFQPVVDLDTLAVVGYEALSRGPLGSDIESPEVIFEVARDFDLVWDLEALCIRNVSPMLSDVCSRGYLFFNLESHFIQQLQQRGSEVFDPFLECQRNVVIEVTERSAIRDFSTFRRALHNLKAMGFKIAIDDCGSGYATLEAVAELHPEFLKVGHSLFRGVDRDPIRRKLIELVARAAESIDATTIAEAIETEEQLRICREIGIRQGQGYLFASPADWTAIRDWKAAVPPARVI